MDWPRDQRPDGYTTTGLNTTDSLGVAISGGFFFNALSLNEVDPFYPAVYGTVTNITSAVEKIDTCLMHPAGPWLHYHMLSPCIGTPSMGDTLTLCDANAACKKDMVSYVLTGFDSATDRNKVLGIARDGHIIYGPYDSNGKTWDDCDVDVCNGLTVDGSYAYVTTGFHPYIVGCWGPGNNATVS